MVKKDKTVDTKIILATSSTVFFGEYKDPTRKFKIALGIEHCINKTPAANPSRLKYKINKYPIIGPAITRPIEENIALFNEKTFSLVNAIPNDIKIKKIVAYIKRKVVFSTKPGSSKS